MVSIKWNYLLDIATKANELFLLNKPKGIRKKKVKISFPIEFFLDEKSMLEKKTVLF